MSTENILEATIRDPADRGKGPSRRLRREGRIPAVVYGKGREPVALSVDPVGLRKALNTPRKFNTVLTVKTGQGDDKLVLVKTWQQHPVTRELRHADFIEVSLDQPVVVEVPVVLVGRAEGVVAGGLLSQVSRTVWVSCLPNAIPEKIEFDVTPVKVNQTMHESDLKLPEGVTLAYRVNNTILTLSAPEEVETPAAEAAKAGKTPGKK